MSIALRNEAASEVTGKSKIRVLPSAGDWSPSQIMGRLRHMQIFPPELVDHIIDHLHDDHTTLSTCALVSRSWVNTARFHLFRGIRIVASVDTTIIPDFLRFLETTPSVTKFIRALEFEGSTGVTMSPSSFSAIVTLLPSLCAASIVGIDLVAREYDQGVWSDYWPPIPRHLDSLVFHDLKVLGNNPVNTVLDFLRIFSSLRKLQTGFMTWDSAFAPESREDIEEELRRLCLPAKFRVESLCILLCTQPGTFLMDLIRKMSVDSITSISTYYLDADLDSERLYALQSLLHDVGSNLMSFTYDLTEDPAEEFSKHLFTPRLKSRFDMEYLVPIVEVPSLSECTSLRSLRFCLPDPSQDADYAVQSFNATLAILESVVSGPAILAFEFVAGEEHGSRGSAADELDILDWRRLETISLNLSGLKKLDIRFSAVRPKSLRVIEECQFVKEKLKELTKRNLLHFDTPKPVS